MAGCCAGPIVKFIGGYMGTNVGKWMLKIVRKAIILILALVMCLVFAPLLVIICTLTFDGNCSGEQTHPFD